MGYFRFRRIIEMLPGVRMNLSKSGPSFSLGTLGARVNVNHKGSRTTLGILGSGLNFTHPEGWNEAKTTSPPSSKPAPVPQPIHERDIISIATKPSVISSAGPPASSQPPSERVGNVEPGPRNPYLYAFGRQWFPKLARSRTNARLPQWLAEAERDYRADNIDHHAYELRRRIILEEMSARVRGVRPKPMTRSEEAAFQREMMAAGVADERWQLKQQMTVATSPATSIIPARTSQGDMAAAMEAWRQWDPRKGPFRDPRDV